MVHYFLIFPVKATNLIFALSLLWLDTFRPTSTSLTRFILRSSLLRLEHGMHLLHTEIGNIQTQQEHSMMDLRQKLAERRLVIQDIQARLGQLHDDQSQADIAQARRSLEQTSTINQPIAQLLVAQQRLEVKIDMLEATRVARIARDRTSPTAQTPSGASNLGLHAVHASAITKVSRCSGRCPCICHRYSKINTPSSLRQFLGVLFIGYSSIPHIISRCDSQRCVRRESLATVVTYIFPEWFLARAMLLVMRFSFFQGPQLSLAFPRVVDSSSLLFEYIGLGDVAGLRIIFSQRIASPFDTDFPGGYTALMVSPL